MIEGIGVIDADGHVNDWHIDWADLVPAELAPYVPRPVRDDLSGDLERRILHDNPARLYGLEL